MTITDRVEKALMSGYATALEIADATGLRPSQVSGALTSLKNQGKAEHAGNAKWRLIGQPEPTTDDFKSGMLFEAVGFLPDRTMLVRQVETHTVYAIRPITG